MREGVREGRAYLKAQLEKLGCKCAASQSNFLLVDLGPRAAELVGGLMARGFMVKGGASWGLARHARISVGLPEDNARLVAALKELLGAV